MEPTPDIQVIDANPKDMLLPWFEFPEDAKYYFVWESPGRNYEILNGWGVVEGQAYLDASGRIDGWAVSYERGTRKVSAPDWIQINAVLYQDHDGPWETDALEARFGGTKECGHQSRDYTLIQTLELPGRINVCLDKVMMSNGKYAMYYYVDVRYRNIALQIWFGGDEDYVDLQWVIDFTNLQMDHILALPLSSVVTWQP